MVRLILIAVALAAITYAVRTWRRLPPAERRSFAIRLLWGALLGVVVLLALSGRLHWLVAAFAALLPLLKMGLRLAAPWLASLIAGKVRQRGQPGGGQESHRQPPPRRDHGMDRSEALATLGLEQDASREQIIQAHRRLMQKVHPDRGGTDHLAARINLAKETLLRDHA